MWSKMSGRLLVLVPIIALVGAACSNKSTTATTSPSPGTSASAGGQITVGMALAAPKNDQGFAQAHYAGLQQAEKDLGIKASVVENALSETQRVNALTSLARTNKLVIGVGGEFAESGPQVAAQFPDVTFAIVNGPPTPNLSNYHAFDYREGVPAYIAGAILAKLTKSKKAGFVGGELIPTTAQSRDAFTAGLHSVDPSIEVKVTIVGTFQDPQKTKAATAAVIAGGADVLYGYEAGTGWPGMVDAVKASGKQVYVASNIFDKCSFGDFIVGNSLLSGTANTFGIIRDFTENKLAAGAVGIGLQNPDVQNFTLCTPFQSQFGTDVQQLTDQINAGTITLPPGV
jgi:basic membrane protein A and related proteins